MLRFHTPKFIMPMVLAILGATIIAGCSTTSRIPDDEMLYVGTKPIKFDTDSAKVPEGMISTIKSQVNVAPNNSIMGWRYPFPYGLWVYNHWPNPEKGFKHWIYELLAEEPVLISDVKPQLRTHMIEQILDNNGYFQGTATYELIKGRNPKKAAIRYTVHTGPAYNIDSLYILPDSTKLDRMIDSLALSDRYLAAKNPRYCTDSLSIARTRITNSLRNHGYYFFKPDFIEYLADSIANPEHIQLKMMLASNTPKFMLDSYKTGKVTIHVNRRHGGGTPDTIQLPNATLIQMKPSRLRKKVMEDYVVFRPGRTFAVRNMDRTQSYLSRLGIFNSVEIDVMPDTTDLAARLLNVDVYCTFDTPLETSLEVNASSKSNSYIGPGLTFGVTNKNIFGGGEQLSVKLTGSYEWQTGHGNKGGIFNSYEFGVVGQLAFPRLLLPKFIPRRKYNSNWTRIQLSADLLNRPHYFQMAQFNTTIPYALALRPI